MSKQRVKLSGHQTFSLRYGWLQKGYEYTLGEKSFAAETAIVELGVGKNMVDSIQYWCELMGIISDGAVTPFARALLAEDGGWDPYLEDQASWWLLHWRLMANPYYATAGTAMFSHIRKPEFTRQDVAEALLRFWAEGKKPPSDSVVMRDVDCYVRSYCGSRRFEKKKSGDDSFDCPFQELGLIQAMNGGDFYRFAIGAKASLPAAIIGYALSEYFSRANKKAMTIQSVLYKEGSPGQVFMLDENTLIEAIEELQEDPAWGAAINFTESAGIAQVHCRLEGGVAESLLSAYYRRGDGK